MSISRYVDQFIAVVGIHFPPPARDEKAALWELSMDKMLRHMEPEVLAKAAEIIIETRNPQKDGKWFPAPAECIAACDRARQILSAKEAPLLSHGHRDQSPWASWRCDLADTLIKTPMGERAASEGWVVTLWHYCREHERLPNEAQAKAMASMSGDIPRIVSDLESGDALQRMCARWGQTFIERRKQMADFISGSGKPVWRE